ncbi:MAG: hypothetical protein IH805_09185, partial [Proteobacteria bacterium]|nr:hypothetical protein [Pseudomonadota bacterium]
MALRVGGRAQQDPDDALETRDRAPQTGGRTPVLAGVTNVAPGAAAQLEDLPTDLTALSLAQLMNVPVRAPEPEDEEESEVAEEDPEDGETIPGVAPDQDGRAADEDDAPAPQASHGGAQFGAPDFGEAGAELPEELAFTLALEGDDPLGDGDPSVSDGGFEPLQFLISNDHGGSGSAQAFDFAGASGQSDPGQGDPGQSGSQSSGLTLTGSSANDTLTGGSGDDTLAGLDGDDTLTGLDGADWLDGGNGKDSLDGGLGADTLLGGNGKDTLTWDALDITIDGGNGQDTLLADGADIDLTAFGGTLASIENIDLSGDGANSLVLDVQDVLDMSSSGTVTIDGDAGDTVDAGTGWTDAGIAGGFHVYTQGLATINLDVDLPVNLDIT